MFIDYEVLKILWWIILGMVLIVYAATSGFDAGITIILPFLKTEEKRRVLLNTSAPVWDGNQTWIIFAGGGLFIAWPVVYATAFSGLYFLMFFILWALFLRPPGYDYRGKLPSYRWKRFWDWALFTSGIVPVFVFGLAFGNCLIGFPFHFDPTTFRDYYTGGLGSLFNGFSILSGIAAVLMVIMHGAAYMQRRTEGELRELGHKLHYIFTISLLITFTFAGYLVAYHLNGYILVASPKDATLYPLNSIVTQKVGAWIDSYSVYPWKIFGPIAAYLGMFFALWANYMRWYAVCFWSNVLAIGGMIGTIGFTLFPFIMPSMTNPDQSLTVWNSTSSQYALDIMLYIGVILFIVILSYKTYTYYTLWSKKKTLTIEDINKDTHGFY